MANENATNKPLRIAVSSPSSATGTTSQIQLSACTIPSNLLTNNTAIKITAMWSGTLNNDTKTLMIGLNNAGGGISGWQTFYNAAIGLNGAAITESMVWIRGDNEQVSGIQSSALGIGQVNGQNPVVTNYNSGQSGLDIVFGCNLSAAKTSAVTITQAAPGVVTWTAHSLVANQSVALTTTGVLPAPLVSGQQYFVVGDSSLTANTFTVSLKQGGVAIATTTAGSGVHTATAWNYVTLEAYTIEVLTQ